MSRRVLVIVAAVVVVLALVYIVITAVLRTEAPAPTDEPSSHLPAPAAEEPTTPGGSGARGTSSPQPTAVAQVEQPDRDDVEATATAWMTVYGTRASDTDETWMEQLEPWTGEELMGELANVEDEALAGHTPTQVQEVRIGDNISGWGRDTPIRWSHEAVVIFTDAAGQDQEAIYRIQAYDTDGGWVITSAEFTGWSQRLE